MLTLRYLYLRDEIPVEEKLAIMNVIHPGYIDMDAKEVFLKSPLRILNILHRRSGDWKIKPRYLTVLGLILLGEIEDSVFIDDYLASLTSEQFREEFTQVYTNLNDLINGYHLRSYKKSYCKALAGQTARNPSLEGLSGMLNDYSYSAFVVYLFERNRELGKQALNKRPIVEMHTDVFEDVDPISLVDLYMHIDGPVRFDIVKLTNILANRSYQHKVNTLEYMISLNLIDPSQLPYDYLEHTRDLPYGNENKFDKSLFEAIYETCKSYVDTSKVIDFAKENLYATGWVNSMTEDV